MVNTNRISITLTEGEWAIIKSKISPNDCNLQKFTLHIRKEVLKVKNKMNVNPESVVCFGGIKIEKRPRLDQHTVKDLQFIALKMGVSLTDVLEIFIINPLLKDSELI